MTVSNACIALLLSSHDSGGRGETLVRSFPFGRIGANRALVEPCFPRSCLDNSQAVSIVKKVCCRARRSRDIRAPRFLSSSLLSCYLGVKRRSFPLYDAHTCSSSRLLHSATMPRPSRPWCTCLPCSSPTISSTSITRRPHSTRLASISCQTADTPRIACLRFDFV